MCCLDMMSCGHRFDMMSCVIHRFMDRFDFAVIGNKTRRDGWAQQFGAAHQSRVILDLEARTIEKHALFPDLAAPAEMFLPKLNQKKYGRTSPRTRPCTRPAPARPGARTPARTCVAGRQYCYVWSFKSANDPKRVSFAAQSIAKWNLCNEEQGVATAGKIEREWFRPNWYPQEPSFAAKPNGTREDDGVLMFIAYDGVSRASWLILADAATLETLAEARLPVQTTFLVHGQFYPA